jgi:hypothetical protein
MKIVLYYRRRRARRGMLARRDFVLKSSRFLWLEHDGRDKAELKVTTKRKYVLSFLETLVCFFSYSHGGSCSGFDASILNPVKKSFYCAHRINQKNESLAEHVTTLRFRECFPVSQGGQLVKRKTSEHATLHDLWFLHPSSDSKTSGPNLKRLSRPMEILECLSILASEVANILPTCPVTLASKPQKERSLLERSYRLAKKTDMRLSDRVTVASLPMLRTTFEIGLAKMVAPLFDSGPLEPVVVAVAVAVALAVARAKVEAFASKARHAVGKVGA